MKTKCPFCENRTHTNLDEIYYYHREIMEAFFNAWKKVQEKSVREWVKTKTSFNPQ